MADAKATFLLEIVGKAAEDLQLVNKKLEEMETNAKALDKMRQGALLLGGAMAVGLGLAINSAVKFESQIAPIKTLLSGTATEIEATAEEIKKSALAWGSDHVNSVDDYTKSMYNALSAGLEVKASIAATQQAGLLATATNGDMAQATELLTGIYNNLGNKTADVNQEMTRLNDILGKTQQKFAIKDLNQLASGLGLAAKGANTYGIPIEQTATIIGQLNTGLLKGPEAGTAFNGMLARLSSASKTLGFDIARLDDGSLDLVKTIGNLKATGAKGDKLFKAFGEGGIGAVSALITNYDQLKAALPDVTNSLGTVATAAKTIESTSAAKLAITLHKLAAAGIKIGEVFLPPLNLILGGVGLLLNGFNWLLEVFPPLRVAVGAIVAVMAVALTVFGSWVFWTKTAVLWQGLFNLTTYQGAAAWAVMRAQALLTGAVSVASSIKMVVGQIAAGIAGTTAGAATAGAWVLASIAMAAATLGISALIAGIVYLFANINNIRAMWDSFKVSVAGINPIFDWFIGLVDSALWGIQQLVGWVKKLFGMDGKTIEPPASKIAKDQKKVADTMPAAKIKGVKGRGSGGGETDWGLNGEFLAANGGPPTKASPKAAALARAGVQNISNSNSGGAVNNSRTVNIANITIDGANITDFESFKLELLGAVGGM